MWRVEADIHFSSVRKIHRPRINPVDTASEQEFFERHGLSKKAFWDLLEVIEPIIERPTLRSASLEPSLQLACALRYFAHGGFLPEVGKLFGISHRAASNCIHGVADAICENIGRFISWPDEDAISRSKQEFSLHTNGFPGILGAIDGTHIPINCPPTPSDESAYVAQKGFHSINAQVVCDSKQKIFSVDAKWPGACQDSFILRQTEVFHKFESGRLPDDTWLLGDSGYPLSKWLLVPVRRPTNPAEERYNEAHRRGLTPIEQCIGTLKTRWRCLTKPIMFRPHRASRIIGACAALHNLALDHKLDLGEELDRDLLASFDVPQEVAPSSVRGFTTRDQLIARAFS